MSQDELLSAVEKLTAELQALKTRVSSLEKANVSQKMLPTTNLLSHSFLTRAFAVLGHYFVAGLIIAVPFYILMFIFFIAAAMF
jgi:hypothetical protein